MFFMINPYSMEGPGFLGILYIAKIHNREREREITVCSAYISINYDLKVCLIQPNSMCFFLEFAW